MGIDLGRKRHYALRAMVALARAHGSGLRKSREIATDSAVPVSYLPQVLAELVRAGLVTSVAGPRGGYATARPPDEISLLEVVEAVGGPLRSALCPLRGGPCTPHDACALHDVWGRAQQAMSRQLAAASLARVAAGDDGRPTVTGRAAAAGHEEQTAATTSRRSRSARLGFEITVTD